MKTALLIIDVQRALSEGEWAASEVGAMIDRINEVSTKARGAGVPVIVIQHEEGDGPMQHGHEGWQLAAGLRVGPGDLRVRKKTPDSFHQTELQHLLQEFGTEDLVVCGMQTEYCIDSTVRRALALGYPVSLVADGHTTLDNDVLSAAQIVAHHNTTLAHMGAFGKRVAVKPAAEVSFAG